MSRLECSVIIPSYNRCDQLERVLVGLARQTVPFNHFEIIVVLDGSTDGSEAMLTTWQQTKRLSNLSYYVQPNSGQATARNKGVQMAQAEVILFLDDDVVPEPALLAAHLKWYSNGESIAVLGDYEIAQHSRDSLYDLGQWVWWETLFHNRSLPDHQPGYHDFCTGNVSLRREDFLKLGGFDTDFRGYGGEDYELGYRLLKAGVRFIADHQAYARHFQKSDVATGMRKMRQEARNNVVLGRKHPELRSGLRLNWLPEGKQGQLARLTFNMPDLADKLVQPVTRLLPLLERFKLRRNWTSVFNYLLTYAYWRGVRDVFDTWGELKTYQADVPPLPQQTLDITHGLPAILPEIWVSGPSMLTVMYKGAELGTLYLPWYIEGSVPEYLVEQILKQLPSKYWMLLDQQGIIPDLAQLDADKLNLVNT